MIYIETGSTDVYYNFALEYYFTTVKQLEEPVFLFWRTEPTVMVGKYQNTLEEINQAYVEKHGIQVVRRMSGGGTIYTDLGGWQFTFIDYNGNCEIQFQEYIRPVIEALQALGVPAEFNGRNDLLIKGRKFSGNAQYKLNGHTVHHGSLLFNTDLEQMTACTTVDPYKIISKSIRSVRERVTNISEHLSRPMDEEKFKEHMVSSILGTSGSIYCVTEWDRTVIESIAGEKFRPWECKYGRNPAFTILKKGRFPGGTMEFRLDVQKGIIRSAAVFGDFFGTERAEAIGRVLEGCPFRRENIFRTLESYGFQGAVYGVELDEMAAVIAG